MHTIDFRTDSPIRKRLALATLALALAGGGSVASAGERNHDGPPPPERLLERMQAELKLSDAQAKQVQQILEQERARHEAAHTEAKAALAKVLTKEQWQQMQSHMRRGGGEGNGERGAGGSSRAP